MSDQPSEEELQDRRLYTMARRMVSACKGIGLSPDDTVVVLATAVGVSIAHDTQFETIDKLIGVKAKLMELIEATIVLETGIIREQQPLQ
jgi:hypothetical protein